MLTQLWKRLTRRKVAVAEQRVSELEAEADQVITEIEAIQALQSALCRQRNLKLQLELVDIERQLTKAESTRETLLKFLNDGPDSIPPVLLKTLPRDAFEYVALRAAAHHTRSAICGYSDAATAYKPEHAHVC